MEIIEEDKLCDNAAQVGEYLQNELLKIAEKNSIISNIRGRGLMTAFDFPDKAKRDKFVKEGMNRNVMFLGCGNQTIRFRPALIMDKAHIDEGLTVLEKILGIL
jgi:L-lysine 6-transaminase